jgi:hypothetical protein
MENFTFHELEKAKAEILYERKTQLSGIQDPDWYEHPTLLEIWERARERKQKFLD